MERIKNIKFNSYELSPQKTVKEFSSSEIISDLIIERFANNNPRSTEQIIQDIIGFQPNKKTTKEYLLSLGSNLWSILVRPWTSKG